MEFTEEIKDKFNFIKAFLFSANSGANDEIQFDHELLKIIELQYNTMTKNDNNITILYNIIRLSLEKGDIDYLNDLKYIFEDSKVNYSKNNNLMSSNSVDQWHPDFKIQ